MIKALFFDMDDTLCDTQSANREACSFLSQRMEQSHPGRINGTRFAQRYLDGIYRRWTPEQTARYRPIADEAGENAFRLQLFRDLLLSEGVDAMSRDSALQLQDEFEQQRMAAFRFYPGIENFLREARQLYTLVVITNGPEYSQIPKIQSVKLYEHVDHILIGGQEPEQKPALSIFEKALSLAECQAHEAIHVGDSQAADIAGAVNANIIAVWIQHQQTLNKELDALPDHTLLHPEEIPQFVRQHFF